MQVEGGSPLHWRSCRGCAFLCAAQDATCEACGLAAPEQCSDGCISDSTSSSSHADQVAGRQASDASSDTSNDTDNVQDEICRMPLRELANADATEVVFAEYLAEHRRTRTIGDAPVPEVIDSEEPEQHLDSIVVVAMSVTSEQDFDCNVEASANDAATEISDDEADSQDGDEVELAGTLDLAPLPGTLVKVFYDDDKWHFAKVLTACGSRARVLFHEDSTQATVDFTTHAVRLADYESEYEGSDDGSDCLSDIPEGEEEEDNFDREEHESEMNSDLRTAAAEQDVQAIDGEDEQELDEEEDLEEEEEEFLEGLLEEAPAVDSLVKVLFEDDCWHTARVKTSNGTKAVVVFETDEEEELDFEVDAVRPFDFVGEEEQHEDSHEGQSTPEATEAVQVVRYENTAEEEMNVDVAVVCLIDPVEEDEQNDERQESKAAPEAMQTAQGCMV